MPLKPFDRKFTKIKTEGLESFPIARPSVDSRVTKCDAVNRVVTEAETNELYESDFEYLVDSSVLD